MDALGVTRVYELVRWLLPSITISITINRMIPKRGAGPHYTTTVIRRVDDSDVQNHGKWRFTGMNLLLKAVLNSSGIYPMLGTEGAQDIQDAQELYYHLFSRQE